MTFRHGKDTVVLAGRFDLSPWLNSVSTPSTFETSDTSHFGTQGKTYIPGASDGKVDLQGLFDSDPTALEDKLAYLKAREDIATAVPLTAAIDGGALVGRRVALCNIKRTAFNVESQVSDVVKVTIGFVADGGVRNGWLLTDLTPRNSGNTFGTVDGIAASTGAKFNLHVTASTASSATVKVQHSTDGAVWVDLTTFTLTGGIEAQTGAVTGTVNRYLRAVTTVSGGTATVALAVVRN